MSDLSPEILVRMDVLCAAYGAVRGDYECPWEVGDDVFERPGGPVIGTVAGCVDVTAHGDQMGRYLVVLAITDEVIVDRAMQLGQRLYYNLAEVGLVNIAAPAKRGWQSLEWDEKSREIL